MPAHPAVDAPDAASDPPVDPPTNGGRELSGIAVIVAHRNAQFMSAQGYAWAGCHEVWEMGTTASGGDGTVNGVYSPTVGTVQAPNGRCYSVWLPGALLPYPEGWCDCPFFIHNAICKHLYFAMEQAERDRGKSVPTP